MLRLRWRGGPNHCHECGVAIPRVSRAFYGNKYRPFVCMPCAAKARAKVDRQTAAWNAREAIR